MKHNERSFRLSEGFVGPPWPGRKPYTRPNIIRFGAVRELTTAGSGDMTENKPGMGSSMKMP